MAVQLYPIGTVSKLTGVPIKTIRYYADIGLLLPAATTDARYRMYSAAEIWRLELVRTLRAFGFGLEDVRGLLQGELSAAQAIAMHLAAVNEQLAHLSRVQRVLERAHITAGGADDLLQHLHELGTALNEDAGSRRKLLIDKMRAMLPVVAPASVISEQFMAGVAQLLPEKMTAEQAAIWAEIVELVNDPAMIEATRRQLTPFAGRQQSDGQPVPDVPAILERARAAADAGALPELSEVQSLVDEWVDLFAIVLERARGPELERWLIEHAAELTPEPIERFWTLMARLSGSEQRPSYAPAQQLLLDGLYARHPRLKPGAEETKPPEGGYSGLRFFSPVL